MHRLFPLIIVAVLYGIATGNMVAGQIVRFTIAFPAYLAGWITDAQITAFAMSHLWGL
jgi:hypothetical protein